MLECIVDHTLFVICTVLPIYTQFKRGVAYVAAICLIYRNNDKAYQNGP